MQDRVGPHKEDGIIAFPGHGELAKEVVRLKGELVDMLVKRDELFLVECKNIESAYLVAVGDLEYKVYELQCLLLRLRRKREMIQSRINRQESVSLDQIERSLDREFARYQDDLESRIGKMNEALERQSSPLLSDTEKAELKKLYRQSMKALHPDLHPDVTEQKQRLMAHAQAAYENGDLEMIRLIATMAAEGDGADGALEKGDARLIRERDRLRKALGHLEKEIERIKGEYPYTLKQLVSSPEKLAARRGELKSLVNQLRDLVRRYESAIKEMLE